MPEPAAADAVPASGSAGLASARRPAPPSRRLLDSGWQICQGDPGQTTPPPADAGWRAIAAPQPVAAALAALGRWSLDGPARHFDAETWWYRLHFDAPEDAADAAWVLGFDGLATLAEVWLNGEHRLSSRNMFRRHVVAPATLRTRGNELLLRFDPLDAALTQRRPRPRWRVPMLAQQQLRWFRTTLLGRTPGWSPPAAVVGPWQPIWLARRDRLHLAGVELDPRIVGQGADAVGELRVRLRWGGGDPGACRVRLTRGDWAGEAALQRAPGSDVWQATLTVSPLVRWWPHTHGEPALYELVVVAPAAEAADLRWPLGPVGFRELVIDQTDGGFGVVVNGVPVFCRGACWVPLDTLCLHATPAAYTAVLQRVRAAGMNMLRVPGTMVYEHPAFFEACDAAGVMVWQDLMFASMDYPADDPAFAAEVEAELAQQLPGWQAHPSLAVVCGNSEVEQQAAMAGADQALWSPALFHRTIPAWVAQHLAGVPYWPSSAHGGDFPFQPDTGTTSYYGVGAYRRPVDDARSSGLRFATECLAFANVPGEAALARVPGPGAPLQVHQPGWKSRVPRDLGAGWDFDDVRDHYAEQLHGERVDLLRASDPAHALALARAASGEAMAAAFAQWRRADALCRGALVWTLRDLWAGAGWGLLDDAARPKPAFHALARVLQPLYLGWVDEGLNGLALHLDHEGAEGLDAELDVVLYQHDEVEIARVRLPLHLAPRARRRLGLAALLGRFMDAGWAYRFGPTAVTLAVAQLHLAKGRSPAPACWFAPGALSRRRPEIGLQGRSLPAEPGDAPGLRRVEVQTRAAAWGVVFDAEGWSTSEAFFHLPPGGLAVVDFSPTGSGPPPPWRVMLGALNSHAWLAVPESPQ